MSYILEALRRAESERARGAVPGLHDQARPGGAAAMAERGRHLDHDRNRNYRAPAIVISALAIAAAGVVSGALWWRGHERPAPQVSSLVQAPKATGAAPAAPSAPAESPTAAAGAVAATAPHAAAPAPAPPPVPVVPAPLPSPAPVLSKERPAKSVDKPKIRQKVTKDIHQRKSASPPSGSVSVPDAAAPTAPSSRVDRPPAKEALPDMPPAIHAQLPALTISGITMSSNPLYRMVIINGQVLHEGDSAAPGVVVTAIRARTAVLHFRGYRTTLGY
jgi:general secretion pathway protein B